MSEQRCECGRPTRGDTFVVCEHCGDSLNRALGDVPWVAAEMPTTVARQRGVDYRAATGSKGPKKPTERPMPANLGAAEALSNLKALLVSWTLLCHEERVRHYSRPPITGPTCQECEHSTCERIRRGDLPADNLPALSRWLMNRVDGLMLHEAGSEAVHEITSAVAHCYRLIDRPAERSYAGPCECGRDLYRKPGATDAKCETCGNVYEAQALRDWMESQMVGKLVTIREGSALLGRFGMPVPIRTLQYWAQQKWIIPHGEGRYLFDDLMFRAAKREAA